MTRTINQEGLQIIEEFEGFSATPYYDAANIPTIGYGTIRYPNGKAVSMLDRRITNAKAIEYLRFHLRRDAHVLEAFLIRNNLVLNDNQFSALMSFAFNVGMSAVVGRNRSVSIALRQKNDQAVVSAIRLFRWVTVKGIRKESAGLKRRREAEVALYLKPITLLA